MQKSDLEFADAVPFVSGPFEAGRGGAPSGIVKLTPPLDVTAAAMGDCDRLRAMRSHGHRFRVRESDGSSPILDLKSSMLGQRKNADVGGMMGVAADI